MLKAVAFDLWETLITNSHEASRVQEAARIIEVHRLLTESHSAIDRESVADASRALWNRCYELYWSRDLDIPTRRQIEHLLEELALELDDPLLLERLESVYGEAIFAAPPDPMPHAVDVVRQLRSGGMQIGLISNTGRTPGSVLRRLLDQLGLGELIDVMLFSNEEGVCKPVDAIFGKLRDSLRCAAGEILFVGDNVDVDVYGAKRSGMWAIHFQPERKGTAFAPPIEREQRLEPDGVITCLSQLPGSISGLGRMR
jgi:putative hydrolase of the HAD superfamily